MALLLLIDTSGEGGFVALSKEGRVLAMQEFTDARRQAALLQPTIAEVCAAAGFKVQAIGAVSVVSGPGSYTGLRVGLAAAKGICFALEVPLFMPNRLLLLGQSALAEMQVKVPLWVVLPARTGEWFASCFKGREILVPPQHWMEDDFKKIVEKSNVRNIILAMEEDREMLINEMFSKYKCHFKIKVNAVQFALEAKFMYENNLSVSALNATPLYLKPAFTTNSSPKQP